MKGEYTNEALLELITAAGNQTELAHMVEERTGEALYQSRISHYLNHVNSIPLDRVPVLCEIAKVLGLKLRPVDFRPDLAAIMGARK